MAPVHGHSPRCRVPGVGGKGRSGFSQLVSPVPVRSWTCFADDEMTLMSMRDLVPGGVEYCLWDVFVFL